ncbi:hypothetical protein B0H13DRAFT_1874497 [Mycena leptocephala]|nr:hypothetical protein B0H13DRAFT_1874497 [Mycena leptocephala]
MADSNLCRNDRPGDGCNGDFPNKTTPGLCPKCQALDTAATQDHKDKIQSIPQCLECGALGQYIKNEKCTGCLRKEKAQVAEQNASQAKNTAIVARPGAWAARMQPPPNGGQTSSSSSQTIIKRSPQVRYITICIEAFNLRTLKAVGWLGSNSRAFPDYTMFGDAIMELIQAYNASFDTRSQVSLVRPSRDVIIRWHGNLGFHRNSDCGTIGEFYNIHLQLHNSETFLRMPTKFKAATQPAVALALFVDPVKFKENHQMEPPTLDDKAPKAKQTKRRISDSYDEPDPKRHAPSRPLTSSYQPMSKVVAAAPPSCSVTLVLTGLKHVDGTQIFPWDGANKITVHLYNDPMTVGKDKAVYKMEFDGVTYVAKRWRNAPTNAQEFGDCDRNFRRNLRLLHLVSVALQRFYDLAETHDFEDEIHNLFEVQPTFIAAEDVSKAQPSVASGVSAVTLAEALAEVQNESEANFPPRILWLIQRCNGKTQDRWNLIRPQNGPNKIDATLHAFTHFFWENYANKGAEVLSHYQTAPGKMANGQYGKLIFDALEQNDPTFDPQRYADDGAEAAQTAKALHQCNLVCGYFGLKSTVEGDGEQSDVESEET